MKKAINLLLLSLFAVTFFVNTGCKKEEITQVVNLDSIAIAKKLLTGRWYGSNTITETYSGSTLVSNTVTFFPAHKTYVDYGSDGTYANTDNGNSAGSGTWQLISPYYRVMDLGNPSQERYYFILQLDSHILVEHGPFKKDGTFFFPTSIYTYYYTK